MAKPCDFGICTAALDEKLSHARIEQPGIRLIWVVPEDDAKAGPYSHRLHSCSQCASFKRVKPEDAAEFLRAADLLAEVG